MYKNNFGWRSWVYQWGFKRKFSTTPSIANIKYGYLYNAYAVNDVRNIAASGWHIPTSTDLQNLITFLGSDSALKICEVETSYSIPFSGGVATNSAKFNGRGSSLRVGSSGEFSNILETFYLWTVSPGNYQQDSYRCDYSFTDIQNNFHQQGTFFIDGLSIRLIKDTTILNDGEEGTYTGNDGKVYRTICIGTQEWLADNLAETKYSNGDTIPTVTDDTEWSELITGAKCAYGNDENNVLI
jgi:uncharacterized protein (TIGR02145 family)